MNKIQIQERHMSNQAELYQRVSFGQHQCGLEMIEILSPQPDDNILDIGSGTGNLTFELAKCIQPTGFVYAVEPDAERVSVAKEEQSVDINNSIWHSESLDVFFKKSLSFLIKHIQTACSIGLNIKKLQ